MVKIGSKGIDWIHRLSKQYAKIQLALFGVAGLLYNCYLVLSLTPIQILPLIQTFFILLPLMKFFI